MTSRLFVFLISTLAFSASQAQESHNPADAEGKRALYATERGSFEDVSGSFLLPSYDTSALNGLTLSNGRHKRYAEPPVNSHPSDAMADTLHAMPFTTVDEMRPIAICPLPYGGMSWPLHQGLNVSIGASVFSQFGKGARGGVGFTQSLSAIYATPLGKHASLSVGGYMDNITWNGGNYHNAGLSAVLGYRFNDKWEAYIYGQKSIINSKNQPYYLYDTRNTGDRIGAAVKYNFNPSTSIQVSVEQSWGPKVHVFPYFDSYSTLGNPYDRGGF